MRNVERHDQRYDDFRDKEREENNMRRQFAKMGVESRIRIVDDVRRQTVEGNGVVPVFDVVNDDIRGIFEPFIDIERLKFRFDRLALLRSRFVVGGLHFFFSNLLSCKVRRDVANARRRSVFQEPLQVESSPHIFEEDELKYNPAVEYNEPRRLRERLRFNRTETCERGAFDAQDVARALAPFDRRFRAR